MFPTKEIAAIYALDFNQIKTKLMHVESGEGWTAAQADGAEAEYRRFLHLAKMYPEEAIAPSVAADMFWHYHILDTVKYAADCEHVFGYFLHHNPYLGLGDESSGQEHEEVAARSQAIFDATFSDMDRPRLNDSAYCAMIPGQKAAGAAAYCALIPNGHVETSKAAYCALIPNGKVEASKAAYCALIPNGKVEAS
ncbi:MAG: hypothetical protein V4857_29135, partial [Pseudomonadota bacterium]